MSRILELAQVIDEELDCLQHRTDVLESELIREKKKNKKMADLITSFLCELQEVIDNE